MPTHLRRVAPLVIIAVLAAAAFLGNLGAGPLEDYDEATYADVARNAVRGVGDAPFALFRAGAVDDETDRVDAWFLKPPLVLWLMSGSMALFGESEGAARLPSALFGVGCVVLTFLLGRRFGGTSVGVAAALLVAVNPDVVRNARDARLDSAVTFFVLLATLQLWRWHRGEKGRPLVWAWAAMGFGFMAKSVIGLLPLPLFVLFLVLFDRAALKKFLRPAQHLRGIAAFLLIVAPWHIAMSAAYGRVFWDTAYGGEVVARVTSDYLGALRRGPLYYVDYLLREQLSAVLLFLSAIVVRVVLRRRIPPAEDRMALRFSLTVVFSIVAAFSLAVVKLAPYLVPAYPFLALATALAARDAYRAWRPQRTLATTIAVFGCALFAALAFMGVRDGWSLETDAKALRYRAMLADEKTIGLRIADAPGLPVFLMSYPRAESLVYYSGRPVRFRTLTADQELPEPALLVFFTPDLSRLAGAGLNVAYRGEILSLVYYDP